jgi:hypothetical protein
MRLGWVLIGCAVSLTYPGPLRRATAEREHKEAIEHRKEAFSIARSGLEAYVVTTKHRLPVSPLVLQ